jgi:hypothetical protein
VTASPTWSEDPPGPPRWARWALAALLFVGALLFVRGVLSAPTTLAVGSVGSEAPRHLWGLWGAAEHLGEYGPLVAHLDVNFPGGYTRHLMDPINLLAFVPGWLVGGKGTAGATLGWNLVHVAWSVLGGLGGWLLARRQLGSGRDAEVAALIAAFACATAPYLMATPWLGRSEMLPGAAWPLHIWALDRALSGKLRWGRVATAAGTLAVVALGGWYLAAWLMLLEPPLAIALAWRHGGREGVAARVGRGVLIGVLGVLPVLPALHALLAYPPPILGEEQEVDAFMGICTPPWMLLPFAGNEGLPGADLAAYPGAVLTLLAAWGGARVRAARPWLALAGALLLLSLGPFLVWSNNPAAISADPLKLPAWYIEKLLPPLRFIWGWCRIGVLTTGPLAIAAALGARDLLPRLGSVRREVVVGLLLLLAIDHGQDRAVGGMNASAFDPRPPVALLDAIDGLPEGALLQLPFDDHYMTWQLSHGRPIAEALEVEEARKISWIVQQTLELEAATKAGTAPAIDLRSPHAQQCATADAYALREAGWAAIVLHKDRSPIGHEAVAAFLRSALGAPAHDGQEVAAWVLRGVPPPEGLDCPLHVIERLAPGGGAGPVPGGTVSP